MISPKWFDFWNLRFRVSVLALLLTLLSFSSARAVDFGFAKADAGQAGVIFDYAASVRSMGMGRAHTGIADDASATYWNPAGLTQLERKDFVTLYSKLHEETGYGLLSYGQPTVDWGTFGLGIVSLRSTNFDKRDEVGVPIGTFDQSEVGVLLSHGFDYRAGWSFGSTVKIIRQQIDIYDDMSFGLDLGAIYDFHSNLQFGATIRNFFAPKIRLDQEEETYPWDLRFGTKFLASKNLLFAADLDKMEDRAIKLHLGTEWRFKEALTLRAGISEAEVTTGFGFQIGDWMVDYALAYNDAVQGEDDLGSSHRLGFHVQFGNRIEEEKSTARWQRQGKVVLAALRDWMDEQRDVKVTVNKVDVSTMVCAALDDHPVIPDSFEIHDLTPASFEEETVKEVVYSTMVVVDEEVAALVGSAKSLIRHNGFVSPFDLYSAQGYIYFFNGEYEKSVQSLSEAISLGGDEQNFIVQHFELAKAQMTEGQTRNIVESELTKLRELYEKGEYHAAVRSCRNILNLESGHVEALAYLEDAQKRIQEPILREMKVAKAKYARKDYLSTINHLLKVKSLDPLHAEAAVLMESSIEALKSVAQTPDKGMFSGGGGRVYEVNSEESRALYNKGLLSYSQGRIKDALVSWKQAVRLDQGNTLATNAYNRALIESRDKK